MQRLLFLLCLIAQGICAGERFAVSIDDMTKVARQEIMNAQKRFRSLDRKWLKHIEHIAVALDREMAYFLSLPCETFEEKEQVCLQAGDLFQQIPVEVVDSSGCTFLGRYKIQSDGLAVIVPYDNNCVSLTITM